MISIKKIVLPQSHKVNRTCIFVNTTCTLNYIKSFFVSINACKQGNMRVYENISGTKIVI